MYLKFLAVASKEQQQQQQQQMASKKEETADIESDRHPSEELDIPGEMPEKPNKKGLKLQLNVREANQHNQQRWQQQQQLQNQQHLLTPGSRGTPKRKSLFIFSFPCC